MAQLTTYASDIPFPEGPVFDSHGTLFVCARRAGYIARISGPGTGEYLVATGGKPNGLAVDRLDRLYVADATRREILIVESAGHIEVAVPTEYQNITLAGPNDLCFGPQGELFFTDPGLSFEIADGSVYRFEEGHLQRLCTGMIFPNGLAITADGQTLYFVESDSAALLAIDAHGAPDQNPRRVADLGRGSLPDGMDWLGDDLVIALQGAGELVRYTTAGDCAARITISDGTGPTNVVVHGGRCYISDDASSSILECSIESLTAGGGD